MYKRTLEITFNHFRRPTLPENCYSYIPMRFPFGSSISNGDENFYPFIDGENLKVVMWKISHLHSLLAWKRIPVVGE